MSRLLPRRFFALVPIPELQLRHRNGARPSWNTRPGLPSRTLGRRSGLRLGSALSSAQAVPQWGRRVFHATSCTARPAKSPTVSRRPQSAIAHQGRRDVSDRPVHAAKPTDAVPFPIISIGGTGTTPPRNRSSRCHPAAVRLNRPTGSSDSSTSPRRSFLTSRQSRSIARVGIMPRAKLYSTRSSRLCRRAEATR